ncbi:hypothetical protein Agub_g7051 [Astrephomene gubernaculifera]|uniref:Uncharacterized protein n=1 Tax=Astrephomene gubernaculifera TaxID=47775 RepID=A0AAD3DS72_9CHLO|nr:hypothetical protein Agub_g7051 [Astrephomene gubernaculifera]
MDFRKSYGGPVGRHGADPFAQLGKDTRQERDDRARQERDATGAIANSKTASRSSALTKGSTGDTRRNSLSARTSGHYGALSRSVDLSSGTPRNPTNSGIPRQPGLPSPAASTPPRPVAQSPATSTAHDTHSRVHQLVAEGQHLREQNSNLEAALQAANSRCSELLSHVQQLNDTLAAERAAAAEACRERDEHAAELERARMQAAELKASGSVALATSEVCRAALSTAFSGTVTAIGNAHDELRHALASREKQDRQLAASRVRVAQLEAAMADRERQLAAAAGERRRLGREMEELAGQLTAKDDKLNALAAVLVPAASAGVQEDLVAVANSLTERLRELQRQLEEHRFLADDMDAGDAKATLRARQAKTAAHVAWGSAGGASCGVSAGGALACTPGGSGLNASGLTTGSSPSESGKKATRSLAAKVSELTEAREQLEGDNLHIAAENEQLRQENSDLRARLQELIAAAAEATSSTASSPTQHTATTTTAAIIATTSSARRAATGIASFPLKTPTTLFAAVLHSDKAAEFENAEPVDTGVSNRATAKMAVGLDELSARAEEWRRQADASRTQARDAQERAEQAAERQRDAEAMAEAVRVELDNVRRELDAVREEVEEARARALEAGRAQEAAEERFAALQAAEEGRLAKVQELQAESARLRSQLRSLQEELGKEQRASGTAKEQLKAMHANEDALMQRILAGEAERQLLLRQIEESNDTLADLRRRLDESAQQVAEAAELRARVAGLTAAAEAAGALQQREQQQQQEQLQGLGASPAAAARSAASAARMQLLEREVQELRAALRANAERASQDSRAHERRDQQMAALRQQALEAEVQQRQVEAELRLLRSQLAEKTRLREQVEELQCQLAAATARADELPARLAAVTAQADELLRRADTAAGREEELQGRLAAAVASNEELKDSLRHSTARLVELQYRLELEAARVEELQELQMQQQQEEKEVDDEKQRRGKQCAASDPRVGGGVTIQVQCVDACDDVCNDVRGEGDVGVSSSGDYDLKRERDRGVKADCKADVSKATPLHAPQLQQGQRQAATDTAAVHQGGQEILPYDGDDVDIGGNCSRFAEDANDAQQQQRLHQSSSSHYHDHQHQQQQQQPPHQHHNQHRTVSRHAALVARMLNAGPQLALVSSYSSLPESLLESAIPEDREAEEDEDFHMSGALGGCRRGSLSGQQQQRRRQQQGRAQPLRVVLGLAVKGSVLAGAMVAGLLIGNAQGFQGLVARQGSSGARKGAGGAAGQAVVAVEGIVLPPM